MSYIGAKPAEQILSSADIQDGAISTVDLADASITQAKLANGVAGTGPAFRAYLGSNTTISAGTYTAIACNTKSYDTATCYNNTGSTATLNGISVPAYSFAPNVAGYYQVNLVVSTVNTSTQINPVIRKNGSGAIYGTVTNGVTGYAGGGVASDIIYMNGTSDYLTSYVYIGTNPTMFSGADGTVFGACLIRGT